MNKTEKAILLAAGATEPSTFNELLRGMSDESPPDGCAWPFFFATLRSLERHGYLEIDRAGDDKISSVILTENGSAEARKMQEKK